VPLVEVDFSALQEIVEFESYLRGCEIVLATKELQTLLLIERVRKQVGVLMLTCATSEFLKDALLCCSLRIPRATCRPALASAPPPAGFAKKPLCSMEIAA
jgi:hypothetical protein